MNITKIELENFRNYEKEEIELNKGINMFYGNNAQGKTNIIESIFLSSFGKSFRTNKDREMIKMGADFAKIKIEFNKSDRDGKIEIIISDKKNILINGVKINKLSKLVGNLNTIIFSPDDMEILKDGPVKRRKFLDMMISQLKPIYLYNLSLYKKTLEQRNNYLRQIKFENKSEQLLDVWDEKLNTHAQIIFQYRREYIKKLMQKIVNIHKNITENSEEIELKYQSDLNEENSDMFLEELKKSRRIDILKGYTTKGIHRDDMEVYINTKNVNAYGSQGQIRTSILSLKLAELYVIYSEIGEYPILLLDDFMSELDEKRRKKFLENITKAQVILTGTHKMDLEKNDFRLFSVSNGMVKAEN